MHSVSRLTRVCCVDLSRVAGDLRDTPECPRSAANCRAAAGVRSQSPGGAHEGHNLASIKTARPCHFRRRPTRPHERTTAMRSDIQPDSRLLTPAEVAALFRVDPKTVTRWAQQGKLHSIRTLGGHRRYREAEVQAFLHRPPHA